MSDDFYTDVARRRLAQIEADEAQAQAHMIAARANGDTDHAVEQAEALEILAVKKQALLRLHQQHVQSQNPPPPPRQTPEQLRAKPAEQMTWADGLEIARQSKYGKNLDFNDPNVVAGYHEATRRRNRGE
jgi:hypothetical protein